MLDNVTDLMRSKVDLTFVRDKQVSLSSKCVDVCLQICLRKVVGKKGNLSMFLFLLGQVYQTE